MIFSNSRRTKAKPASRFLRRVEELLAYWVDYFPVTRIGEQPPEYWQGVMIIMISSLCCSLRWGVMHLNVLCVKREMNQRHEGESRRRSEVQRLGHPERADVTAGRLPVRSTRTGNAHGLVLACWFRNAASPASETSTHFLSGSAPAT